jgi:hypothetical protein
VRAVGAVGFNTHMAYDEQLAERVRELIAGEPGVTEQRMFGGLAFLIGGNMSVGVSGQGGLLVRVPTDVGEAALAEPHVEPMVMRGRAMTGWLRVGPDGVRSDADLRRWVAAGVDYARSLPAKPTRT